MSVIILPLIDFKNDIAAANAQKAGK